MARSLFLQMLSISFALFFSLSLSAPVRPHNHTVGFSKRQSALYDLWKSIPGAQIAKGDSALDFKVDQSKNDAWGVTYLHGCTAILISDPEHVMVGHMQEDGPNKCINLSNKVEVQKYITGKLQPATDNFDASGNTRVHILWTRPSDGGTPQLDLFKNFLTDEWDLDAGSISDIQYSGGSGSGEAPDVPNGKAVIQWIAGNGHPKGTLKVFFNQETPIREDNF